MPRSLQERGCIMYWNRIIQPEPPLWRLGIIIFPLLPCSFYPVLSPRKYPLFFGTAPYHSSRRTGRILKIQCLDLGSLLHHAPSPSIPPVRPRATDHLLALYTAGWISDLPVPPVLPSMTLWTLRSILAGRPWGWCSGCDVRGRSAQWNGVRGMRHGVDLALALAIRVRLGSWFFDVAKIWGIETSCTDQRLVY